MCSSLMPIRDASVGRSTLRSAALVSNVAAAEAAAAEADIGKEEKVVQFNKKQKEEKKKKKNKINFFDLFVSVHFLWLKKRFCFFYLI
jgi:hypothetical protein